MALSSSFTKIQVAARPGGLGSFQSLSSNRVASAPLIHWCGGHQGKTIRPEASMSKWEIEDLVRKLEERTKVHVQSMERKLEKALSRVEDKLEELRSEFEEPIFKENVQRKFHYVFGDHIGDSADVVSRSELNIIADLAWQTRRVNREERKVALGSDIVATAGYFKDRSGKRLMVAECSLTVKFADVRRAARRAKLWATAYGLDEDHCVPFAVGREVSQAVRDVAAVEGVTILIVDDDL